MLATLIDCAATAYQGLDLNETFLMRLVGDELDFFLGRIASLDIVPLKLPLPEPTLYVSSYGHNGSMKQDISFRGMQR